MHATPAVGSLLQRFPREPKAQYEYGTAGFRMAAVRMAPVALRVGLFMASQGAASGLLGVMVTASHNPVADNGIKLVQASGEMMDGIEEAITAVANMPDDRLLEWIGRHQGSAKAACLLVGRDTRPSGAALCEAVALGAAVFGVPLVDVGLVTTPQLHHYVRSYNGTPGCTVAQAEAAYLAMLREPFNRLVQPTGTRVVVDCANGVGALTLGRLTGLHLDVALANCTGVLNEGCGADYVKLLQRAPAGLPPADPAVHYASFDGDADRVVFFRFDADRAFHLLDGDRIAVLLAETLARLTAAAGITASMGVVQTAYANGASTRTLRQMGVETCCTATGVRNLHHEAKRFDIGIYFEANGHGTVLFSEAFRAQVRDPVLAALVSLVNACVGDAISDLLLVEAVLALRGLSLEAWEAAYAELPSVQLKLAVPDRSAITTTNADQTVVRPPGLQAAIDELTGRYAEGRCFVRPSGTEDVVRVYAEARSSADARELAERVRDLVATYLQ